MTYSVLRSSNHRQVLWKNGLGLTTEIHIDPVGATLEDFAWRLSMARIERDAPFSHFANIDRLLMMLEGSISLTVEGRAATQLTPEGPAIQFAGELTAAAHVLDPAAAQAPAALDLNLMVRRGVYSAQMRRIRFDRADSFVSAADVIALLCRTESVTVRHEQQVEILERDDVFMVRGRTPSPIQLQASHAAVTVLYLVELTRL